MPRKQPDANQSSPPQSRQGGQDKNVQPGGQGRVKDPAHDRRLKQNRDK